MTLPIEYRRLEYIQSSGSQYIDTGVKATGNEVCELVYRDLTQGGTLFGVWGGNWNNCYGFHNNLNTTYFYYEADTTIGNGSSYLSGTIKLDKNIAYFNGNEVYRYSNVKTFSYGNIHLFHFNDGGYPTSFKLYSFSIKDNDVLVRNFIPAKRKSDNVLGLYDLVNDVFYTNAGSGTFTAGPEMYTIEAEANPTNSGYITGTGEYLPSSQVVLNAIANNGYEFEDWTLDGYTRLEYIEFTGTQYIDTNILTNNMDRIVYKMTMSQVSNDMHIVAGSRAAASSNYRIYCAVDGSSLYAIYNSERNGNLYTVSTNTEYEIDALIDEKKQYLKVNGTTILSKNLSLGSGGVKAYIGAWNGNGTITAQFKGKIFYIKIYNQSGTVLIRDYIPVVRHRDGTIGLLDLVNLKFYGNSGTGFFFGGDPV